MEVTGHTHYNTHKMEDTHNHFMVVSGSLEDVTASLTPTSSWTVYIGNCFLSYIAYIHACCRLYMYTVEYYNWSENNHTYDNCGKWVYYCIYTEHKTRTGQEYRLSCIMFLLVALVEFHTEMREREIKPLIQWNPSNQEINEDTSIQDQMPRLCTINLLNQDTPLIRTI